MAQSTSQQRTAWKAYECQGDKMLMVSFGPDRIRVAPPTADAWHALASVLQSNDYQIRPADTDSYNCRAITGGTGRSLHSYGIALDVNWTTNPYRRTPDKRKVRFSGKPTQAERAIDVKHQIADTDMTPALIDDVLAIRTTDGKRVFEWGGNWTTVKDPMHFELDVTPEELATGIDWSTVKTPPEPAVALGSFDVVQPLIEKWEGGFSNHPDDPGGATNMGITQETLARWRGHPVTTDDVRQLTREEARQIFRADFWQPLRADELPLPAAEMTYNASVLSGPARAAVMLQQALNMQGKPVAQDGDIGAETIAAARTADQRRLVDDFAATYEAYLRSLPAFATFGKGWLARLADFTDAARQAAGASVPEAIARPVAESATPSGATPSGATPSGATPSGATPSGATPPRPPVAAGVPARATGLPNLGDGIVSGALLKALAGAAARTLPSGGQMLPLSPDALGQVLGSLLASMITGVGAQASEPIRSEPAATATQQPGPAKRRARAARRQ